MTDSSSAPHPAKRSRRSDLVGSYFVSYLVLVLLLGTLVYLAGIWRILANTRFLDLLISSGIVGYHDVHLGVVTGIPDHQLFLLSQDPVDWRLVALVAALYFLFWGVKAIQFHGIARFLGMKGGQRQHSRAYFYGVGLNILCPYRLGNAAVISSCKAHGEKPGLAGAAVYTQELFVLFEVAVFALLGLALNGWSTWLGQLFWPVVICGVAYLAMKPAQVGGVFVPGQATRADRRTILRRLFEDPRVLTTLALFSLLAFLIDDVTPYLISQAFTTDFVILNVPFPVIQMGVVGGYIARQVSITPGGIGQWEWGFAAALYMGGVGLPEAATIALLESLLRHGTGVVVFAAAVLWKGSGTSMREVFPRVLWPFDSAPGAAG
jgi:uncharacterized membrane protein YbhN (UPF0104 family)